MFLLVLYRVVQLNLTQEIEVFHMLFVGKFNFYYDVSQTAYRVLQLPVLNPFGPPCILVFINCRNI